MVKKGDPLLEVFSTDLAEAKSDYETARSQWNRDKKVLDYKAPLAKSETIARKELIEIENDEAKSRLQMKLAKDKLLVYGLTEKEIEDVRERGRGAEGPDDPPSRGRRDRHQAHGRARAITTTSKDELMQIAPLDHLWVLGQRQRARRRQGRGRPEDPVIFPYSDQDHRATRSSTSTRPSIPRPGPPSSGASIPNPEKRFKAGMFVRVLLEIPPKPGETVIPRGSMVSVDRLDFVFLKQPGRGAPLRAAARSS